MYCEEFVSHALDLLPIDYMERVIAVLPRELGERAREKHDPSVPDKAWAGVDEFMRVWSRQIPEAVAPEILKNELLETQITAWEDTEAGYAFESVCRGVALDCFKHDKKELLLNVLARMASECLALMICKESRAQEVPSVIERIHENVRSTLKPMVEEAENKVARYWGQFTN